jgi:hypothetical protein
MCPGQSCPAGVQEGPPQPSNPPSVSSSSLCPACPLPGASPWPREPPGFLLLVTSIPSTYVWPSVRARSPQHHATALATFPPHASKMGTGTRHAWAAAAAPVTATLRTPVPSQHRRVTQKTVANLWNEVREPLPHREPSGNAGPRPRLQRQGRQSRGATEGCGGPRSALPPGRTRPAGHRAKLGASVPGVLRCLGTGEGRSLISVAHCGSLQDLQEEPRPGGVRFRTPAGSLHRSTD